MLRSPPETGRLNPQGLHTWDIPGGRIGDMEIKLRKLSLEDHTNAVSVLFGVFIELSLDAYIDNHSLKLTENDSVRKKLDGVSADLRLARS